MDSIISFFLIYFSAITLTGLSFEFKNVFQDINFVSTKIEVFRFVSFCRVMVGEC